VRTASWLLAGVAALLPMMTSAAGLTELIKAGDRKAALEMIRAGADVNALADDGSSPLLWAVHRVDHQLVDELLRRGAKPDLRNVLGATALTEAIELVDEALVGALIKAGADPNLGNDDAQTPLMLAARGGSLPVVETLVKAGAKVNAREKYREQTALMWAVGASHAHIADYLIAQGAEVELRAASNDWGNQITSEPRAQYRPTGGLTPLLIAARSGCLACVRSLLKAGVDIDRPTPDGVTPLMLAIDNANYAVAKHLLEAGANPHLADWWGRTALYVAVDMNSRGAGPPGAAGGQGGARPFADSLDLSLRTGVRPTDGPASAPQSAALQVARRLLELGADPNIQLNMHRPGRGGNNARFTDDLLTTGCTPLIRAAWSLDIPAVELLLAHGALVDLPNVMGVTPLMAASGIGYGGGSSRAGVVAVGPDLEGRAIHIIGLLLAAGADVNARILDTSSRTAVIARPNATASRQGQTAIFGTISRDWPKVAQFLLDKGARVDIKDDAGKTLREALQGKAGGRDEPASPEVLKVLSAALGH
jgi:ankyrin repeat protein